jgi:hypothetical protein
MKRKWKNYGWRECKEHLRFLRAIWIFILLIWWESSYISSTMFKRSALPFLFFEYTDCINFLCGALPIVWSSLYTACFCKVLGICKKYIYTVRRNNQLNPLITYLHLQLCNKRLCVSVCDNQNSLDIEYKSIKFGSFVQIWDITPKNLQIKSRRIIVLPVVSYGYETWSLKLREERSLTVFENRVLKRIFGSETWRKESTLKT